MLVQRAESLARPAARPLTINDLDIDAARAALAAAAPGWLPTDVAARILTAGRIPAPRIELARTATEAANLARAIGFPVALKVASPDILHKSDVGGVLLQLESAAAVADGFTRVMHSARAARPEADIVGVHVQPMLPSGQDVIVGVVRDPQFGPLLMFGSGGVEVEGLKDVAFALAPLVRDEGEYLLENTWAGRKLRGFRHLPTADREAVLDVMMRLGQLAADLPQLAEIEINPLRVMLLGQGAAALDVRMRLSDHDATT
jgi:acetyltransferase